jgi:hypothetical protein
LDAIRNSSSIASITPVIAAAFRNFARPATATIFLQNMIDALLFVGRIAQYQGRFTMTIQNSLGRVLLRVFLIATVGVAVMHAGTGGNESNAVSAAASTSSSIASLLGTWSGTFTSNSPDISPFTITVVIAQNSKGRLLGNASVVSQCIKSHPVQVTVNGSNVVLAGSDADGDNITFKGTLDGTGTLLTLNYVVNGSASRSCEIDNGSGTMGKR